MLIRICNATPVPDCLRHPEHDPELMSDTINFKSMHQRERRSGCRRLLPIWQSPRIAANAEAAILAAGAVAIGSRRGIPTRADSSTLPNPRPEGNVRGTACAGRIDLTAGAVFVSTYRCRTLRPNLADRAVATGLSPRVDRCPASPLPTSRPTLDRDRGPAADAEARARPLASLRGEIDRIDKELVDAPEPPGRDRRPDRPGQAEAGAGDLVAGPRGRGHRPGPGRQPRARCPPRPCG